MMEEYIPLNIKGNRRGCRKIHDYDSNTKTNKKRRKENENGVKITEDVVSVRVRSAGPDYRSFVTRRQGQWTCLCDSCEEASSFKSCKHILAAIQTNKYAEKMSCPPLLYKSLMGKYKCIPYQEDLKIPHIFRVSKNTFVLKTDSEENLSIGYLHISFYPAKSKYNCGCGKSQIFSDPCTHFIQCIALFSLNVSLSEEFQCFVQLFNQYPEVPTIANTSNTPEKLTFNTSSNIEPPSVSDGIKQILSPFVTQMIELPNGNGHLLELHAELHSSEADTNVPLELSDIIVYDEGKISNIPFQYKTNEKEENNPLNIEIMLTDDDNLITLSDMIVIDNDSCVKKGSNCIKLVDDPMPIVSSNIVDKSSLQKYFISMKDGDVIPISNTNANVGNTVFIKNITDNNNLVNNVSETNFSFNNINQSFLQCLSGITEMINLSMTFVKNANMTKSTILHVSHEFFDFFHSRISASNVKRRLPNETVIYERKSTPPFGKFTKSIWKINTISHLKSIFDTPTISLQTSQVFKKNKNGSYNVINKLTDIKDVNCQNENNFNDKFVNISPGHFMTFLKIGKMTPKDEMKYFRIEWTPDLLPTSKIGELVLKYEYICRNNCSLTNVHKSCK